jgi:hypothetical protein
MAAAIDLLDDALVAAYPGRRDDGNELPDRPAFV